MPPFRPIRYLDHLLSANLIHDMIVNIPDFPLVGLLQHSVDFLDHFLFGQALSDEVFVAHNFAPPQLFSVDTSGVFCYTRHRC